MSQSCDGLHLNGVPLLQGVVQNSRGVHHLLPMKEQKFGIPQIQTIQKFPLCDLVSTSL